MATINSTQSASGRSSLEELNLSHEKISKLDNQESGTEAVEPETNQDFGKQMFLLSHRLEKTVKSKSGDKEEVIIFQENKSEIKEAVAFENVEVVENKEGSIGNNVQTVVTSKKVGFANLEFAEETSPLTIEEKRMAYSRSKSSPHMTKDCKVIETRSDLSRKNTVLVINKLRLQEVERLFEKETTPGKSEEENPSSLKTIENQFKEQSQPINSIFLKSRFPYLTEKTIFKKIFNKKLAVKELSECIRLYPDHFKMIEEVLLEIQSRLMGSRSDRLQKTLLLAARDPENSKFFSYYFKFKIEGNIFAKKLIINLTKKKYNNKQIIELLSLFTRYDLELQRNSSETLFRQSFLSSSLCREYVHVIWSKELEHLKGVFEKEIKIHCSQICLDWSKIKQTLTEKNPIFPELDPKIQNQFIEKEMKPEFKQLNNFLTAVIPEVYKMNVPKELSDLFKMRRKLIAEAIGPSLKEGQNIRDQSRVYLSELVFLRVINPNILSGDKNIDLRFSPMFYLSKFLQTLANEVPPGSDKNDDVSMILKPLYDQFITFHLAFLDAYSL